MAKPLSYQSAENKLLNGLSLVEVYDDWVKSVPAGEMTDALASESRAVIAFAWDACRKRSIKMRKAKGKK